MANISLTKENIKYLRDAFSHFFPEDTIYSADKPYISGEFNWENRRSFIDFVYRLTGIQIKSEKDFDNIKKAQLAVEELTETEKAVESNRPTSEQLKTLEKEEETRKTELEKTRNEAKSAVEKSREKKEQIYKGDLQKQKAQEEWSRLQKEEVLKTASKDTQNVVIKELAGKKVYAVPDKTPPKIILSKDEQKLVEIAKTNPKLFTEKLSSLIVEKNPDIPTETLGPLSKIVAVDVAKSLSNPETRPVPTGVFAAVSKASEYLPGISVIGESEIAKTASIFTTLSESQQNLYRTLLVQSIGTNLANEVLGFPETTYHLSETPSDGSYSLKLDQLQTNSFSLQEGSVSGILNNPTFTLAGSAADGKLKDLAISKLQSIPSDGFLGRVSAFTNSRAFDNIAPFIGAQTNFNYIGTNFFGKAVTRFLPEYTPLITNLSAKLGFDIGISAVAPVAVEAVAAEGAVAKTAVGGIVGKGLMAVATKLGLGTTITALGQALGSFAPIVGNAIAFVATTFIEKIVEKINWKKVKEWSAAIVGGVAGLIALPFLGLGAAIGIGAGATAIAAGLGAGLGGATLAGVGAGIAGFFGAIGGAFLGAVGMPILITLLAFPVAVAIILFIINSGAYVVPPTEGVFGNISSPYIGIVKTPEPPGPFSNNEFPKTITYKVTISAKMGILTNVSIKYDCIVVSSSAQKCPSISNIPTSVDSISPSNPYSFTYTSTYNQNYKNSAIIDTITVVANTMGQTGVSADGSASVIFGTPPISCPLPSGKPINSNNYSYNSQSNTGHGSTSYWNAMGEPHYRYPLPQLTSCFHPSDCLYYGYALDVFPNGSTTVYAPTVSGKSLVWSLAGTFTNPGAGYSLTYTDTTGVYTMVLTHIFSPFAPTTVNSGAKITTLFNQGSNTHLHMEFQVNGRWVKPENYFCK